MSSAKIDGVVQKKPPLSLRMRLALGYTVFFTLVLTLMAAGVFLAVRHTLLREMEQQLATSSDLLQHNFSSSNATITVFFNRSTLLLHAQPPQMVGMDSPSLYVQVVTLAGDIAATSINMQDEFLPFTGDTLAMIMQGQSIRQYVYLANGQVMMLSRPLVRDHAIVGMLQVAEPMREVDRTLKLLLISLIVTGLVAMVTALSGGTWLAGQALRPVGKIANTAQQIVQAQDLALRVPDTPTQDEIGQLTETINAMLARLEQLFSAQHRFVANVSHEFQTPLAAMRGHLDILRRGARHDPEMLGESLLDMERELLRLTRLTSDLLLLARAEAGLRLQRQRVALDDLVLDVIRTMHPLAHDVTLTPTIDMQVEILGDYDRLKQALINMVANALQYTPAGGSVEVGLTRDETSVRVWVADTGVGIAAEEIPRLFEHFYRTDKARSRRSGGAGIGLAIVKWITQSHNGTIDVESTPGKGSRFTMVLPL